MKNSFFFFLLFCLPVFLSAQQTVYSRVKIYTDAQSPEKLFATGIEISAADLKNKCCFAEISQQDINRLAAAGFRYEIVIPDLTKYYTERFTEKVPETETDVLLNEEWPQPVNFSLGSCGGFSTVDQMIAQLDLMRTLYPNLISIKHALSDTISTIEGRQIYYVKISDNPDVNESEPQVLYTGMHHAREPIGMQHLLYYMWYLLENYNTDPSIKGLVDSTEMYFVPVFNVDGFTYNITTAPDGGGMWRKNRRDSGSGNYGVDINRNYGYEWGYDDSGSSPDPGSEIYRGTSPFSEPETRMMKYFCESHDFKIAINYHSYAGLFLYAWGWSATPPPDNTLFDAYANVITKESNYTYGPGNTTIYPTNGGSDDWMYGEQTTKPAILAYTPEIGNNGDGFWPPQSRILPLIRENMYGSLTAARLVGNYGKISDNSSLFIYEQSGYLPFKVKRLGMQGGNYTVSVTPLGSKFASVGDAKAIQIDTILVQHADSISYQFNNTINVGDTVQYVLTINNGYFSENDTVTRIFGFPVSVFNDNLDNATNWTGTWGLSNWQFYSPATSMADSPYTNYSANDNKSTILTNEIPLPNVLKLVLQFHAKWNLEKDYDFVQLSISQNNGATWTPLQGKFTHPGTVNQAYGQPVYDGKMSDWVREEISLDAYMGKNVKFKFRLKADQGVEFDGYFFDDFNISMLLDPTGTKQALSKETFLGNPYPNPADDRFEVSYSLPQSTVNAEMTITNPTGILVSKTKLTAPSGNASIDVSKLVPGIYFISIRSAGIQCAVRKLIVE